MTDDIPTISFKGGEITFSGPDQFVEQMNKHLPGYKYDTDIREILSLLNYCGYHFDTARGETVFSGLYIDNDFVITHVIVGDTVVPEEHFKHINIPEMGIYTAVSDGEE